MSIPNSQFIPRPPHIDFYSCIGSLNVVKVSVLSNLSYRFKSIQIKIPEAFFVDINKLMLKFYGKAKEQK